MSDDEIRAWWTTHSEERAKAQTVNEWLLEYAEGVPWITRRLVRENPIER